MKKIFFSLLFIIILIFSNNKTNINTSYREYESSPSDCNVNTNCEALLVNDGNWFKNWREKEATRTLDGSKKDYANVMFLVDVSGSMQGNTEVQYIEKIVRQFSDSLKSEDYMGIAQYGAFSGFAFDVKALLKKELNKSKNFDSSVFLAKFPDDTPNFLAVKESAFDYASNELAKTSKWSYDIVIWLTDAEDALPFESVSGGTTLKNLGIKFYVVNIGNNSADTIFWGEKTRETGGKYYYVDTTEALDNTLDDKEEVTDKCKDKEYATNNVGKCCTEFPDTCSCSNEDYAKKHASECNTCSNENYKKEHKDICTTVNCNGKEMTLREANRLNTLFKYIRTLLDIVKIAVPIILILYGSIDMIKAMIANDEDAKKNYKLFGRRIIYGVCIFLIGTLVNFLIGLVGVNIDSCEEINTSISYVENNR